MLRQGGVYGLSVSGSENHLRNHVRRRSSSMSSSSSSSSSSSVAASGYHSSYIRSQVIGGAFGVRRVAMACVPASSEASSSSGRDNAVVGAACDVNALKDGNFAGCSLKDLEIMYVDAVWNYYKGDKEKMIDNETYDMLKIELNYQASGMPDLSRREVEFVEASICYARGEPIMSDTEYEKLKGEIKIIGKKMDVTAMMLSIKGQEYLTPEQYATLADKMLAMGIDVGIEGATCTLTETPDSLSNESIEVLKMYLAIGFLPTVLLGILPWTVLSIFSNGDFPSLGLGFGWTLTSGSVLTYLMIRYMDLHNTEILTGQCPCCEAPVKLLFSGDNPPDSNSIKCPNCGATSKMNRVTRRIIAA